MRMRGVYYGPILDASGAEGFFGGRGREEEYRYRRYLGPFKPNFAGITFVSKTSTLLLNKGNAPMRSDGITLKELFPKCIKVYFRQGMILNAMALPGPGFEALLEMNRWQKRTEPFLISVMSIGKTPEERLAETREFMRLILKYRPDFKARFCVQKNYSCTNVGMDTSCLIDEVRADLDILEELDIALMPKFSVLAPADKVKVISEHRACDAICISNTVHWGDLPQRINWKGLFGSDVSPLAEFGDGALSGWPLLPLTIEWIVIARAHGLKKPIYAGGGILSAKNLVPLRDVGASSVFIGSVATLRPWRIQKIVKEARNLFL